jgi:hypothetical protein
MMLISSDLTMSSPTHVLNTELTTPPSYKIDDLQPQIIQLKEQGFTHKQVLDWLANEGIQCTLRTLERRLQQWGVRREAATAEVTDELAERVNYLFHHNLYSDSQIASKIIEEDGLQTSARQVKEIRLLFGWQRRYNTASSSTQQETVTQTLVQDLLHTGPGRSYGRRWAITYLRHQFGHRARQYDVANAQRLFDPQGVASRVPGMRKKRLENYITAGPDYLTVTTNLRSTESRSTMLSTRIRARLFGLMSVTAIVPN